MRMNVHSHSLESPPMSLSEVNSFSRPQNPSPRSDEILDMIRPTFAGKGFDGASMQDLARAAGMSVGNFYRYFPSKAAIVEAIVMRDMAHIEQDFSEVILAPAPLSELRLKLSQRLNDPNCAQDGVLWAEISAAALRKPEVAQIVAQMETMVLSYLLTVFVRVTGLQDAEVARKYAPHAGLILMLVRGNAIQKAQETALGHNHKTYGLTALIERQIQSTLDEISNVSDKN
jgi:AcrR family transcriptional regulator